MRKYGDILIILNMGSEGLVYPFTYVFQILNFKKKCKKAHILFNNKVMINYSCSNIFVISKRDQSCSPSIRIL